MEHMLEFMKKYDALKVKHPELYLHISEFSKAKKWRIHIYARNLGRAGDAELACVEDENREEAFKSAAVAIEKIDGQIDNLKKWNTD